jgi:hypothetical protein
VVVVLDGGEELKVLARNKLDGPILATPAIVDGKIYVRTPYIWTAMPDSEQLPTDP